MTIFLRHVVQLATEVELLPALGVSTAVAVADPATNCLQVQPWTGGRVWVHGDRHYQCILYSVFGLH